MSKKRKYVTVSIPIGIANDIDKLIEELGYWPSKGAFVREACTEKIWKERKKMSELRRNPKRTKDPKQAQKARRGTNPGMSPRETAERRPRASTRDPQKKRGENK